VEVEMMDVGVLFAGVAVADFTGAVDWYARLFGRPADIIVNDNEVMWRFADAAWLYVVGDAERAGRALVALCVPDLDETVAEIAARGIISEPVVMVGASGRKASVIDADGNTLSFIEVPAPES
jgi:predicted enzyme related to lactoylglutathione lyase